MRHDPAEAVLEIEVKMRNEWKQCGIQDTRRSPLRFRSHFDDTDGLTHAPTQRTKLQFLPTDLLKSPQTNLSAESPQVQLERVVDESPQWSDVSKFTVPKGREIFDDVVNHFGFRHLFMRIRFVTIH